MSNGLNSKPKYVIVLTQDVCKISLDHAWEKRKLLKKLWHFHIKMIIVSHYSSSFLQYVTQDMIPEMNGMETIHEKNYVYE